MAYGGVNSEFSNELGFYCTLPSGIEGGKEYIDNIYETQLIDAIITILVEYRCSDGSFSTLFDGKLNLPSYRTGLDDDVGEMTFVNLERNDFWQTIRDRRDIKVNVNSLLSLDGSALTAYTNAPAQINVGSQIIDLGSVINGGIFTDSDTFTGWDIVANNTNNIYMQSTLAVTEDDLETINDNTNFSNFGPGLALAASGIIPFYTANSDIIDYPEPYKSVNLLRTDPIAFSILRPESLKNISVPFFLIYPLFF